MPLSTAELYRSASGQLICDCSILQWVTNLILKAKEEKYSNGIYILSDLFFLKAGYVLAMQNYATEIIKSHVLGPVTQQTPSLVQIWF